MLLKDADSTPTVAVRKNGASTADSVTITKRSATTGIYDCSYNPAGEVEGDQYTLEESATVTGTTTGSATYNFAWTVRAVAVERGTDGANTTTPPTVAAIADEVQTRTIARVTLVDTCTTNTDMRGTNNEALAATALSTAVWTATIAGRIDADISSRATPADVSPTINFSPTIEPTELSAGSVSAIQSGLALESSVQEIITTLGEGVELDSATITAINEPVLEAIAGIEGGGGGTVNVLPATGITADRSAGTTLKPVIGETISQAITVYQTDGTTPVDLSGKTLAIIFETMAGVDVAVVAAGSITISGDDDNVVTFAYPSAVTASERVLRFAIRDAAAPLTMYLQGYCSVVSAPKVDA
jgi:hypothetical protein